jgi:phytoene synthase
LRALFEIDAAMADVVARSTDPALGRIKLAWWRERLEALDSGPPPGEPRLRAVAEHLLPLGVSGAQLAELESGWATLVDESVEPQLVASRGESLFRIGGTILGGGDDKLELAGALYALASVARRGVPELSEPAKPYLEHLRGHRFDQKVRPLTMLARAAIFEGPDRAMSLAMLAHRWSGRIG